MNNLSEISVNTEKAGVIICHIKTGWNDFLRVVVSEQRNPNYRDWSHCAAISGPDWGGSQAREPGLAPCQGGGNGVFMSSTQSIHEKLNIEIINIER